MPTYAYRAMDSEKSCHYCRRGFEVIQRMTESALTLCPQCKNPISRVLFAPTVVIKGHPLTETDRKIKEYEKEGKWSMAFHRLFPEQASRRVVVITLLAILELVKMKRIRIFQLALFETIRISPV